MLSAEGDDGFQLRGGMGGGAGGVVVWNVNKGDGDVVDTTLVGLEGPLEGDEDDRGNWTEFLALCSGECCNFTAVGAGERCGLPDEDNPYSDWA